MTGRSPVSCKQVPRTQVLAQGLDIQTVPRLLRPSFFSLSSFCLFVVFKNSFNVYLFLRERESMNGEGAEGERERERQNRKQVPQQHRAGRGARTHQPRDCDLSRSWMPDVLSRPAAPFLLRLCYHTQRASFTAFQSCQPRQPSSQNSVTGGKGTPCGEWGILP